MMKTKYIKIAADYCADGLWDEDGSMIDLPCLELNLSDDIIQRLDAWQRWHDKENQDYLDEPERTKKFDRAAFSKEGLRIARDIKTHLGKDWTVMYFDDKKYHDTIVDRSVYEYEV